MRPSLILFGLALALAIKPSFSFAQQTCAFVDGVKQCTNDITGAKTSTTVTEVCDEGGCAQIEKPAQSSNQPGGSQQTAGLSRQEIEDLRADCEKQVRDAKDACTNGTSTTGMSAINKMAFGEKLALIGTLAQVAASATGNSKICTVAAGLQAAAQVASMIKGQACSGTQSACANRCDEFAETVQARIRQLESQNAGLQPQDPTRLANETEIKSTLSEYGYKGRKNRRTCEGFALQAAQAVAQANSLAGNLAQAAQCAKDTASDANLPGITGTPPPLQISADGFDCSNPQVASSSMACICKTTPTDPMCAGFNGGSGSGGAGGGMAGGSIATPGISPGSPTDGDLVDTAPVGGQGKSGSYGQEGGGGGGGLGGGSGGGGLLGGGDGEGAGGSGLDKNVITGTSGGGGVGALTAGSSGGGGGGAGKYGGGSGGGGGFNFKKYLPKSLFKNRGLAGMTVPSTDGITGPMGPSIWEKVTNRYQVKKSSLIQDK